MYRDPLARPIAQGDPLDVHYRGTKDVKSSEKNISTSAGYTTNRQY